MALTIIFSNASGEGGRSTKYVIGHKLRYFSLTRRTWFMFPQENLETWIMNMICTWNRIYFLHNSFPSVTLLYNRYLHFWFGKKKNSHYRQKYGFKLKICISIQAGTGVILIALMHSFGNLSQASYSTFESKKFQSSHYEQRSSDSVLHECHMTIRISHWPLFWSMDSYLFNPKRIVTKNCFRKKKPTHKISLIDPQINFFTMKRSALGCIRV